MSTFNKYELTFDDGIHYLFRELKELGKLPYTTADWILVNNLGIEDVDRRDSILAELENASGVKKRNGVYILIEEKKRNTVHK